MTLSTKGRQTRCSAGFTVARCSTGLGCSMKNWFATKTMNSICDSMQQGGKIWHSPRIKSWYSPRRTLSALFQQYLQYGYWRVRVIQKRKAAASVRQFVPGMFVLSLLTLPLVGILWSPGWWFWLAAATSYILCTASVSLGMAARHGWRFSCTLPAVFACYHLGYGLGFVHGLWDFVLLRRGPSKLYTSLTRSTGSSDNLRASYFSSGHHADRVKGN